MNLNKTILGLLTPLITAGAAWLTASVAKYGVHLDQSGVNAALVTGAAAGLSVMIKLIHDVESDLTKELDKQVPADQAQVIQGVLQAAEPQLRQAVLTAVHAEVISLARSIQPAPAPAPAPAAAPVPIPVPVGSAPASIAAGDELPHVAEAAVGPPSAANLLAPEVMGGDPASSVGHPLLNGRALGDTGVPAGYGGRIPRQG